MSRAAKWLAVACAACQVGLAAAHAQAQAPAATREHVQALAAAESVDTRTLVDALATRGFQPPERFKALVVRVDANGALHRFDYAGTSDDRDDWWPASSIKLYAAIAALERMRALGFSPAARVTLAYAEEPIDARVDELIEKALQVSDNRAFDALVALVGYDAINGQFFGKQNGFRDTVFIRAYGGRDRDPVTGHSTHLKSPAITLREGERTHRISERVGKRRFECPDQGNCTTLQDLCEAMRRVALHETLPADQRFDLGEVELTLLRKVLGARKLRSHELPAALQQGYGAPPLRILDKPGYAMRWMSDVMFLEREDGSERWLVAVAGYGGRRVLDDALLQLGAVLASGALGK